MLCCRFIIVSFGDPGNGDGLAPVALAGEDPVTELEVDGGFALAVCFKFLDDLGFALVGTHAGVFAGVDHLAYGGEGEFGAFFRAFDDLADGDVELSGKFEVAVVVGGDGHDGAGAVAHEDVVGDPDGDFLAVERVNAVSARGYAGLFLGQVGAVTVRFQSRFADVFPDCGLLLRDGDIGDDRVFRGDDHVGSTEKGVGAGRIDGEVLVGAVYGEVDFRAFGAADPGGLLAFGGVGPVEAVKAFEEFVRVGGDAEDELAEVAAFDWVVADFALAVHDFFVGQDCPEFGAPPDGAFVHKRKAVLEELEEDPLGPAEVAWIRRVDLAVPVDGEAKTLDLAAEIFDVGFGRDGGVGAGLDCVLFRWESECVPTHWVEDVVAIGLFVAGKYVGRRVTFRVADMEAGTGGVREHVQGVVLGLVVIVDSLEGLLFFPVLLPAGLDFGEFVGVAIGLGHGA